MTLTPYPYLDESLEHPAILVSHDGITWKLPNGAPDPLTPPAEGGFHADPDMLRHPDTGELWLYYLHTIRGAQQRLMRICSADRIHWSAPETVLTAPYHTLRSPALDYRDGVWRMWNVNIDAGLQIELATSQDGTDWSAFEPLHWPLAPRCLPSHIDVAWNPQRQTWWMIAQAQPPGGGPYALYLLESADGRAWRGPKRPLLTPYDAPEWAAQTLYRSALIIENDVMKLWYSGRSPANENRIAYVEALLAKLNRALDKI
ncbi:hypothetical protein MAIT1_01433 [Magnetofaba australis IT-1]|uniref:Uncharacterized protein n=2 Tax=Magnetofaba TaxID=1472292 RepID=A0A1Y2K350_9PROT|nr:hypothetical protein MAIT1_01433 [Magnetofaba australis IT-1]